LLGEEDVLGLEIAVDDAGAMRFFERAAHLHHDLDRAVRIHGALLAHGMREVLALHVIHHEVRRAVGELAEFVDARRVGVRQLAHRTCLAPEAGDEVIAAREARVQHLDRHEAIHVGLLGFVDGPHAADADALEDLVFAVVDRSTDQGVRHRPGMLTRHRSGMLFGSVLWRCAPRPTPTNAGPS
jgi:hypothetical protein